MASSNTRREMDLQKLLRNDYAVEMINDSVQEFNVSFKGPTDNETHYPKLHTNTRNHLSLYDKGQKGVYVGGVWKVRVELPKDYPYSSPFIGFVNKIYHPNIDFPSGSVCMDVLNQCWSPVIDLYSIFEHYLPQLLMEPNAKDPFNDDAATLLSKDKKTYEQRVKEYCERYAKPQGVGVVTDAELGDGKPSDDDPNEDDNDSGDEATVVDPANP